MNGTFTHKYSGPRYNRHAPACTMPHVKTAAAYIETVSVTVPSQAAQRAPRKKPATNATESTAFAKSAAAAPFRNATV